MVKEEVETGCCNAAVSGPILVDGVCCWDFCTGACCGRPVRVLGEPVVASIATRRDWLAALDLDPASVPEPTRAALHADYMRDAFLEHASIASFAVFTLELLAVGAPPSLVADAQAAAVDEIAHARDTFAAAAAFGGSEVGPGPLPIAGIAPKSDLAAIVATCVRDGCIGETVASLVAAEQARRARLPGLREMLARIAEDEARHAELAWRFVAWALASGDAAVRVAVASAFEGAAPTGPEVPADIDLPAWEAHGRLSAETYAATVRAAMEDVIRPCAAALLGRPGAAITASRST